MSHTLPKHTNAFFLVALAVFLTSTAPTLAEDSEPVFVVNLPEIQEIAGSVRLEGPTPQSRLVAISEDVVAPVDLADTTSLVLGGNLDSSGFVSVVLSLTGEVKSSHFQEGRVGAVLVPDQSLIRRGFTEGGQLLFPLQVEADALPDGSLFFSSNQPISRLAFPRYRVYFYNTTDRPASVTLYAYLTN